jgi:hypothetical protein
MQVAEVKIWGKLVGAVAWDTDRGFANLNTTPDSSNWDGIWLR